ncbi:hypothetical protein UA08_04033 [Talaromyces atroroseus]|uniref:Uncharacterized protein n=1 Tax=Talaromyces atroroseus TaxID=1441469 RepID=A0A1Q5Q8E0_TALAT|nr:hypothetical protein UA08_04033 [Talaromyces atroroseus]OKL60397.1 hypothetical protein UA08_04033 [Talaromyces atroroseus]
MAELSLILLPVPAEISMSEKAARSLPKQQQYPYQYQPYQPYQPKQLQQPQSPNMPSPPATVQSSDSPAPLPSPSPSPLPSLSLSNPTSAPASVSPSSSPAPAPPSMQSTLFDELASYQRIWDAIHQRTVKQLQWIQDAEDGIYTSSQLKSMLCASFDARIVPQ